MGAKTFANSPLGGSLLGLIAVGVLVAAISRPALAEGSLTLVAAANTVDTVISEVILRKACRRLGIDITIKKYPGERP